METKEGLSIYLESSYTHKVYNLIYKDIEYIYEYDYDNGMWENERLEREDKQDIDDETYAEIMEIINNINDWNDVEE
jgi:hypothetical protein